MSILHLGEHEQRAITKALELARDQTLPWSIGKRIVIDDIDNKTEVTLQDRKHTLMPRSQHLMLGSYHCAISFAEQPAGLVRHLSVSVKTPGKVPNQIAMQMLAEAFGFSAFPPPPPGRVWPEEFQPGHYAINIAELTT